MQMTTAGTDQAARATCVAPAQPAHRPSRASAVAHDGPPVLDMAGVDTRPDGEGRALEGASLTIRRGEIVGVAGVEGNGQHTLVRALAGLVGLERGSIRLGGADVTAHALGAASLRAACASFLSNGTPRD